MTHLRALTPSLVPVAAATSLPTPTSSPLEVTIHSDPATGWDILAGLGPLAVLIGASLAAWIGWRTLKQRRDADKNSLEQKQKSDDRSEWWRRAQWALDHAVGENPDAKTLGLVTLEKLALSKLASDEEIVLFDVAWEAVQSRRVELDPTYSGAARRRMGPGKWFRRPISAVVDTGRAVLDNGGTNEGEEAQ